METSIIELEKRMTYLEKYVEELNEVIVDQQRQLDRCQKELSRLRPKSEPSPIGEDRGHDEKPPHY
ncbi:MAG: SlyX family protein [Candidatus Riflebacteria bacterium]|nr:SlyX family protein [Candidatus Riflebacteria bacterium]